MIHFLTIHPQVQREMECPHLSILLNLGGALLPNNKKCHHNHHNDCAIVIVMGMAMVIVIINPCSTLISLH